MNVLDINNFRSCAEVFLYANTPAYLYKHLRNCQEATVLAERLSTQELYELAEKVLGQEEISCENELVFYICLIALSFKIYSESHTYLKSLMTDKYKWAKSIISFIISDYIPISEDEIRIQTHPKIIVQDEFDAVPSTVSLDKVSAKHVPEIVPPQENFNDAATLENFDS